MREILQKAAVVVVVLAGASRTVAQTLGDDQRRQAVLDTLTQGCCSATTTACEPQRCRCGSDLPYSLWLDKNWFVIRVQGLDVNVGVDVTAYHWGSFCPGGLAVEKSVVAREGEFTPSELSQFIPQPWLGFVRGEPTHRGQVRIECHDGSAKPNAGAQEAILDAMMAEFQAWLSRRVRRGDLQAAVPVELVIQPFAATSDVAWVLVEPLHEIWEVEFIRSDSCNNPLGVPDAFMYKDHRIESADTCKIVPRNCYTEADVQDIKTTGIRRSLVAPPLPHAP